MPTAVSFSESAGRLNFHEATGGDTRQIIFSVKGGRNIGVAEIRDLLGVLERERAATLIWPRVYISFAEPTRPMRREAAEAGFYISADGSRYPRLQLLTIQGLLDGTERLERPLHVRDVTFKRAPGPVPPPPATSPSRSARNPHRSSYANDSVRAEELQTESFLSRKIHPATRKTTHCKAISAKLQH